MTHMSVNRTVELNPSPPVGLRLNAGRNSIKNGAKPESAWRSWRVGAAGNGGARATDWRVDPPSPPQYHPKEQHFPPPMGLHPGEKECDKGKTAGVFSRKGVK